MGNISEAARQAAQDLPEEERQRFREAVSKRAVREQWLSKAEQAVSMMSNAPTLQSSRPQIELSNRVQSGADLLSRTLLEDGNETRIQAMRYAKRAVTRAAALAQVDPDVALEQAGNVKSALQSAAIAGNWQSGSTEQSVTLQFFSITQEREPEKSVEGTVIDQ